MLTTLGIYNVLLGILACCLLLCVGFLIGKAYFRRSAVVEDIFLEVRIEDAELIRRRHENINAASQSEIKILPVRKYKSVY